MEWDHTSSQTKVSANPFGQKNHGICLLRQKGGLAGGFHRTWHQNQFGSILWHIKNIKTFIKSYCGSFKSYGTLGPCVIFLHNNACLHTAKWTQILPVTTDISASHHISIEETHSVYPNLRFYGKIFVTGF